MEEVRDDLAVPLWLFAVGTGDTPCARGVASGDDGALAKGISDIRTCAVTSGDFPEPELNRKQK